MSFVTSFPRLRRAVGIADLAVFLTVGAVIYAVVDGAREWTTESHPVSEISLSPWALPRYTLLSLMRGFAAYVLSLAFTLIYGRVAAYNKRAEKIMVPLLDIFQSIPVLGFLPGLVLALVALFPKSNIGLELACVLMIFTGQVWNMTFSFYHSLQSIPMDLREAARVYRLSGWQKFTQLELPYSIIGLVWNSMMSMAGGWFFLTVTEAFVLGKKDFRLPGVGSYMSVAIAEGNIPAMILGVVAMVVMIVAVDWLLWRPLVAWSQKFKVEETEASEAPTSSVLEFLRSSNILRWLRKKLRRNAADSARPKSIALAQSREQTAASDSVSSSAWRTAAEWLAGAALLLGTAFGAIKLVGLLSPLGSDEWLRVGELDVLTFIRVVAAVVLGSLWTIPVGVVIGMRPRLAQRLQPVTQVMASFPAPMLFPLVLICLHAIGVTLQAGSIVLMMLGTQWYILFNVIAGATAIPQDLREAAAVYRLGRIERWRRLILPAIFPSLVTGWVTAMGGAWNASIVAEYLQFRHETLAATGLGAAISRATDDGNFAMLAACVLVMCVTVVAFNRTVWKRLFQIAEDKFSLNR